jgi:hypothetical protein
VPLFAIHSGLLRVLEDEKHPYRFDTLKSSIGNDARIVLSSRRSSSSKDPVGLLFYHLCYGLFWVDTPGLDPPTSCELGRVSPWRYGLDPCSTCTDKPRCPATIFSWVLYSSSCIFPRCLIFSLSTTSTNSQRWRFTALLSVISGLRVSQQPAGGHPPPFSAASLSHLSRV